MVIRVIYLIFSLIMFITLLMSFTLFCCHVDNLSCCHGDEITSGPDVTTSLVPVQQVSKANFPAENQ